jgi:alpha-beta hydrolase superfamily lysophospholipase
VGGIALYFSIGAYCLSFGLSRFLFPHTPALTADTSTATRSIKAASGNELLVRRFGRARTGCVVFFPGQHGGAAGYDFSHYVAAGIEVFDLAYPGQDGASGRADLREVRDLARQAVAYAQGSCPPGRVVLVGVSLGAMLAAYSAENAEPAGLLLLAAAPSLSSALRLRLRAKWYLLPLSMLPLSKLVAHDYTLVESLQGTAMPVVIFQGTRDEQTPIAPLGRSISALSNVALVRVPDATHSTTFELSRDAQIGAIESMLKRAAYRR